MGYSIPASDPRNQWPCLAPTFGQVTPRQMAGSAYAGTEVAHAKGEGRVGRSGKGL